MAKIVHMTSVHSPLDPRIFAKECVSLARAGHEVVLIAVADGDTVRDGVRIRSVPAASSQLKRMIVTTWHVFRAAFDERADAYHFHDPELIPWGLLLRLLGRRVLYDVHEDYISGIAQKTYLPRAVRPAIARLVDGVERLAARAFRVVLAERYYVRRFPQGVMVLNYPTVADGAPPHAFSCTSRKLLYTGNVTIDRGALLHAAVLTQRADVEVHVIGRCSSALADLMKSAAGAGTDRLSFESLDAYVPFARIRGAYERGGWLAGLAVFPSTPHYREKELTKFFEYMHAGLPIICSDFPVWRGLVEKEGVGLCVAPGDPVALANAIEWLIQHPAEAAAMGRRGQELVKERFNWPTEARKLTLLYDELLRGGTPNELIASPGR
jgi:glycosyltransferase involved in cell wall biosynthesis